MLRRAARFAGRTLSRLVATRTIPARNDQAVVSFTFDNIPASAAWTGAEILERAGALGTFYVACGLCGTSDAGIRFASEEDLSRLASRGHELGCHTFSDVEVTTLGRRDLEAELQNNQNYVREHIGDVVLRSFAYPFGAASLGSKRQLQTAFASCRSTVPGLNTGQIDLGFLRAERLYDTNATGESILTLLQDAQRRCGWLIFYTHDVQSSPSLYGVSPELFEFAVKSAKNLGLEILPVRNALGRLAFD